MKAVILERFGDSKVLKSVEDFPKPELKGDEVLVRVKAVALNHLDIWVRKGALAVKPALPHILGSDISGVVERVGSLVKNVKEGDEVVIAPGLSCGVCYDCQRGEDNHCRHYDIIGLRSKGGYAQYISVPARNVIPKPENLSFEEAASYPLTFLTAWNALVRKANLKPFHRVLIWGGSSGVGVAAIQIAKLMGAYVIATAGNEDKLAKCKQIGADHVINHYSQDVVSEVRSLVKEGVDIAVDHVGSATFTKSVESLKKGGSLVFFGTTTGDITELNIRYVFVREIKLQGVYMGSRADLFKITELFKRGLFKPVVDKVFPLEEAPLAHEHLEASRHFGKVVLRVN